MTWKRMVKLKCSRCSVSLMKHIKSLTARRVLTTIKHFVWVGVVLGATVGCLVTISDRIKYLVSRPTATTISVVRHQTLTFPAVTVCNLNNFRVLEILEEKNLTSLLQLATLLVSGEGTTSEICNQVTRSSAILSSITFEELALQARQPVDDLIQGCFFAGKPCGNITEVFEPVFTSLGICYTFNSGKANTSLFQSMGTGQRQGLQLVLNVNQQSNSTTVLDIGLMIAINSQSEPPLPANQGIGVPAGRNAFISIKQKNNQDQTERNCSSEGDISTFNFLQENYASYSESACLLDCLHARVADNCECISVRSFYSPDTPHYSQLPNCTLEKICCIVDSLLSLQNSCNCRTACSSISYEAAVSYSSLPAEELRSLASNLGLPSTLFPNDFLTVSMYFETLNVETQITSSVYSPVALLSDIGGQIGLFLGLSVISVLQFGDWIFKVMGSQELNTTRKRIKAKCASCCQKHSVMLDKDLNSLPTESETSSAS